MSDLPYRRWVFHGLLAYFTANAGLKFFLASLDSIVGRAFILRVFEFTGNAPDQYRILPFLGLKWTWQLWQLIVPGAELEKAILIFNTLFGWFVYEGFFRLNSNWTESRRLRFNFLFAVLYAYWLFQGWRPETLGFFAVCLGNALLWQRRAAPVWCWLALLVLAFCRADTALVYALFYGAWARRPWPWPSPAGWCICRTWPCAPPTAPPCPVRSALPMPTRSSSSARPRWIT